MKKLKYLIEAYEKINGVSISKITGKKLAQEFDKLEDYDEVQKFLDDLPESDIRSLAFFEFGKDFATKKPLKLIMKKFMNENKIIKEDMRDHFQVANELQKIAGFDGDKADSVISGFNTSASLSNKNKYRAAIKKKNYKKAAQIVKKYWKS